MPWKGSASGKREFESMVIKVWRRRRDRQALVGHPQKALLSKIIQKNFDMRRIGKIFSGLISF
jgi:hypothetical protein